MIIRALALWVAPVVLLVASCGDKEAADTPPSPQAIQAKVVLPAPLTWIPTQFGPQIVELESVSKNNEWPKNGDSVRVNCVTQGGPYGSGETKWYGIIVPTKNLSSTAVGRAKPADGGYEAYLEAAWLPGIDDTKLTGCSSR